MSVKRVLIVDDDATIRQMVAAILENEQFTVVQADDGLRGIEILDQEPRPIDFTFVMLDVSMPRMTGLEMLTRMKLHAHTRDLPVIMLTGEARPEDVMAGYTTGADYYITKPFTRQQLLYGLSMVLEGR